MAQNSVTTIGNFRQGARIYAGTTDVTKLVERYSVQLTVYGNSKATLNVIYDYNLVKTIENPTTEPYLFSYGSRIAIYVEHPFKPGDYLQIFYGEVSGAAISRSKYRSETGIAINCVGFLHHVSNITFPYGLGMGGTNANNFFLAASTGSSASLLNPEVTKLYTSNDELQKFIHNLLMGQTSKLSDLINIAFLGANSLPSMSNSLSYNTIKDRFLYVINAEFPSSLQKTLGNLLNNKLHLKNLGDMIKTIVSYLLCEIFCDSNGSIVVKPPCWSFGIPNSHFIHPMLIQNLQTNETNHLKYTRVMIRSQPSHIGALNDNSTLWRNFVVVYKEDNTCQKVILTNSNIVLDPEVATNTDRPNDGKTGSGTQLPSKKPQEEFDLLAPSEYEKKYGISLLNPNPILYSIEDGLAQEYLTDVVLPYGKYMLTSANKEASTGSIQLACGAPWLRVGFNCMILPFNKVYYIAALSHSGTPGGRCNTTISGNYGTSFEALQAANKSDIHHFVTPNGYDSLTIPNYTDPLVIDAIPEDYKTW